MSGAVDHDGADEQCVAAAAAAMCDVSVDHGSADEQCVATAAVCGVSALTHIGEVRSRCYGL